MSSNDIYTAIDRTPYTYYIYWKNLNLHYYGKRSGLGCHPDELFVTYFTSSKLVSDVRAEYGEPDIIFVHKIFSDILSCSKQEENILKGVGSNGASSHLDWLNQTNGDLNWDVSGKKFPGKGVGRKDSEQTKLNKSKAAGKHLKDKTLAQSHKNKISISMRGKVPSPKSEDGLRRLREARLGVEPANKGKQKQKIVCRISDKKLMDLGNFLRWQHK